MLRRLILVAIICSTLLCVSCIGSSSPKEVISSVLSDDIGNTLIAYRVERSPGDYDIHLQKIAPEGAVLWDNTLFTGDDRRANVIGMVSDGNKGVFVAWEVLTPENGKDGSHRFDRVTLMKVDEQGQIQWRQDFFEKGMQMVGDGMGGVIMAWTTKEDYRTQRVDGHGNVLWEKTIGSGGTGLKLAAGENGESFILWDNYDSQFFEVQKISADGELLWGEGGMDIKYLLTPYEQRPQIISGGFGSAIVTWAEVIGNGQPSSYVLVSGMQYPEVIWKSTVRKLGSTVHPWTKAISDGYGGVIVAWEDHRQGMALYAMRKNPIAYRLKLVPWPENGVPVCTDLPAVSPRFETLSNGDGGVVVAWIDGDRKLYAQMLDAHGQKQWGDKSILIASGVCNLPVKLSGNSKNGFIIAWCDGKKVHHPEKSYVQRIDSQGKLLWGEEGIRLNP